MMHIERTGRRALICAAVIAIVFVAGKMLGLL
jgi:hypothetical protein